MNIEEVVKILYSKNSKEAYAALKVLLNVSAQSDELYPYFDQFVAMSEDADSYIRTRGLLLIAANARWDEDNMRNRHSSRGRGRWRRSRR